MQAYLVVLLYMSALHSVSHDSIGLVSYETNLKADVLCMAVVLGKWPQQNLARHQPAHMAYQSQLQQHQVLDAESAAPAAEPTTVEPAVEEGETTVRVLHDLKSADSNHNEL